MATPVGSASVLIEPDLSQFASSLSRQVQPALAKAATAMGAVDQAVKTTTADTDKMGASFGHAATQAGKVAKSAEEGGGSVKKMGVAFGGVAAGGAGLFAGALLGATGVVAGLGLLATKGLGAAGAMEQTRTSFTALLGPGQDVNAFLKDLQAFAAKTPFEFPDLTAASQKLLSMGVASKDIIPQLTAIGDTAAVLGAPGDAVDRVTNAFRQMSATGKVNLEDIGQLTDALPGFNAVAAIAASKGISSAEAMKQIQSGAITAKDGINGLLEGMKKFPGAAGAMDKQGQTLNGMLSTLKDTVSQSLTTAFEPLLPAIKGALGPITDTIGSTLTALAPAVVTIAGSILPPILDLFAKLGPIISQVVTDFAPFIKILAEQLSPVISLIGPILVNLGKSLIDIFTPLVPVFADILSNSIVPLMVALIPPILEIAKAFMPILVLFGDFINVIVGLMPVLTPIIDLIVHLAGVFAIALVPIIEKLLPIITSMAEMLGGILGEAVRQLLPPLVEFAITIGGMLADAIKELWPILQKLWPIFQKLFDSLVPIIPIILDLAMTLVEALLPVLPVIIDAVVELALAFLPLVGALLPLIPVIADLAKLLIKEIGAPVLVAIAQAFGMLAESLTPIIKAVADLLAGGLKTVIEWLALLVKDPGQALSKLGEQLGKLWDTVEDFFGKMPEMVGGFLKMLGEKILDAFKAAFTWVWDHKGEILTKLADVMKAIVTAIPKALIDIGEKILVAFVIGAKWVWDHKGEIFDKLKALFTAIPQLAVDALKAIGSFIWDKALVPAKDFIVTKFPEWRDAIVKFFEELPGRLVTALGDIGAKLWEVFGKAKDFVVEKLPGFIDSMVQFFKDLPGKIVNAISSIKDFGVDFGKKIVNSIIGFINENVIQKLHDFSIDQYGFHLTPFEGIQPLKELHEGAILPGFSGADSIPALLAPGEAVVPSAVVRAAGRPAIERLIQGQPFSTGSSIQQSNQYTVVGVSFEQALAEIKARQEADLRRVLR